MSEHKDGTGTATKLVRYEQARTALARAATRPFPETPEDEVFPKSVSTENTRRHVWKHRLHKVKAR